MAHAGATVYTSALSDGISLSVPSSYLSPAPQSSSSSAVFVAPTSVYEPVSASVVSVTSGLSGSSNTGLGGNVILGSSVSGGGSSGVVGSVITGPSVSGTRPAGATGNVFVGPSISGSNTGGNIIIGNGGTVLTGSGIDSNIIVATSADTNSGGVVGSNVIVVTNGSSDGNKSADDMSRYGSNVSSRFLMRSFSQVAQITDHLFLCSANAVTPATIQQHGVTHVINLTVDIPAVKVPHVETTRVSIDDLPQANLGVHFDRLADHIRRVKERGGRTLVHCVAGVSRSASTCIAYLMKYYHMPLADAYHHVKSRRPVIRPNAGFFAQLIDYERRLFGRNSVRMVDSPIGPIPDVYHEETKGMVFLNGRQNVGRAQFR